LAGRFRRTKQRWTVGRQWRRGGARLILGLVVAALAATILGVQYRAGRLDLHAGELAPDTLVAPRFVRFADKAKTENLRQLAAS